MASTINSFSLISLKYEADGNRIFKDSSESGQRKYIVDIVGDLPVILMELNNSGDIVKTYIYANSQIIAQHTGDHEADRYFYLHDRLGSVRQIIDTSGNVKNRYTYDPFGETFSSEIEEDQNLDNVFKFTGQYFDSEIDQYYLRARQYDPHIARFTARDPIFGRFQHPLTLHAYLYCINDPVNRIDRKGEWAFALGASASGNVPFANLNPFNWQQGALGATLGGEVIGKMVGYHCIVLPYFTWLTERTGLGGTVGAAFVVAKDEQERWNKGWEFGGMTWRGWGGSFSTSPGMSAVIDMAYSPEAQHISDLGGGFVEAGFSGSLPIPSYLGINTASATISWGLDESGEYTGISLWTFSFGWGLPGTEAHVFTGYTWVSEPWFKN